MRDGARREKKKKKMMRESNELGVAIGLCYLSLCGGSERERGERWGCERMRA